ncbi:MAG TPA: D-ribose pyranase [Anaerolineae bacterium]|nr:D-ribose pyranase [Anaerolineae bacterium]
MKKIGIINQPISAVIASLGHTDTVVVADAGLPIPAGPERIDLALSAGLPTFLDTLRVVLTEMQVERAIVADEMLAVSPAVYQAVKALLGNTPIDTMPHQTCKEQTRSARAVIRTGEFTPYANIILVAGVVF